MSDIASDIARIAAMRGKPAANYVEEQRALQSASRRISAGEIRAMFVMPKDQRAEFMAWDALPRRSRMVLSDLPLCPSATKYADMLVRVQDEDGLITVIRGMLPTIVRDWVMDHYGRGHPSVRRLG